MNNNIEQKEKIEVLKDKQKEAELRVQQLEEEEEQIRQNLAPYIIPIAKKAAIGVMNKRDSEMANSIANYIQESIENAKTDIRKEMIREIHRHTVGYSDCPHCKKAK